MDEKYVVINKAGCIHNCHTKERYEAFKAAGWEDYKEPATDELSSLTKANLLTKAKELGIEGLTDSNTKDEIIQAIKAHEGKE